VSLWLVAVAGVAPAAQTRAPQPQLMLDRAITDFETGRIADSVAGFDNLVKALRAFAPQLWQRGMHTVARIHLQQRR
jgi:hypothetical protein